MGQKFPDLDRSGRFMLFFQADGLCQALRLALQLGHLPGPATVELLKVMRAEAQNIGKGNAFDRLPDIIEESPVADMLVAAEVIRTTMLAFLSPEEIEEQRRTLGFSKN